MLSLFSPPKTHATSTAQDWLFWGESELRCRRGWFLSACSPLSASFPWPTQGERSNGPERGKERQEFCSLPDFVFFQSFQFLYSSFSTGLTWNSGVTHSISEMPVGRNGWEVIQVQPAARGRTIINKDKVSGFVREPWRHQRMDIPPPLHSSVTTFLVKQNVRFEPSKLKLVSSSLDPLQFPNISVELGGPKAGHSIAAVATPVPSKGGKPYRDLLATDIPHSAICMMRTHCWLIFGLVSSIKPSSFLKGVLLSHRVSSPHW